MATVLFFNIFPDLLIPSWSHCEFQRDQMAGEINFECFKNIFQAAVVFLFLRYSIMQVGRSCALELHSPVIEFRLCHLGVVSLKLVPSFL